MMQPRTIAKAAPESAPKRKCEERIAYWRTHFEQEIAHWRTYSERLEKQVDLLRQVIAELRARRLAPEAREAMLLS